MLKYAVQTGKMNEIMELLFRVLDLRITFFDLQEGEVEGFNIKEMSPFCRHFRKSKDFKRQCSCCDQDNLQIAKKKGAVHIYHCHAGLLEGIVPLYDRHNKYLGAIVFGQLRNREHKYTSLSPEEKTLLLQSRESSEKEMFDTGVLLKYLSEYISDNEIIKYCNKPWAERLDDYIHANLNGRLTLRLLADETGRSISFLSHNFTLEFGMPLKAYIRQERMKRARELLESGKTVHETAFELGFYDEFHFSKDFKRYYGLPPSKFKVQP